MNIRVVLNATEIRTKPKYRCDYGQVLEIVGQNAAVVDICNAGDQYAETVTGQNGRVAIPDKFFEDGRDIVVYVVKQTERYRITTNVITIPIIERSAADRGT